MTEQPILSEEEWGLVIDLLLIEHSELPVEIHHARSSDRRDELHHRRELVDGLLARLRPATATA